MTENDMLKLLHENIINHGSVDDLLVTNKIDAFDTVKDLLTYNANAALYTDDIYNKYNDMHNKYIELLNSKTMRYTAPLRKIYHAIKRLRPF